MHFFPLGFNQRAKWDMLMKHHKLEFSRMIENLNEWESEFITKIEINWGLRLHPLTKTFKEKNKFVLKILFRNIQIFEIE